jgi:Fe-S-cluster containining protein
MPESELPIVEASHRRSKLRREDLQTDDVLCNHCRAKCCRYFAFPIDKPTDWQDFDYLRWYLMHERASVFIEEGCWYMLVHNPCQHLREDQRCDIYDTRPQICRDYTTQDCEYEDDWIYEHYWETPEQIEEYAATVLGPREGQGIRSPRPQPFASAVPPKS